MPVEAARIKATFQSDVRPLLSKYCLDCHNEDNAEAGIRLDHLTGQLPDRTLKLWQGIEKQLASSSMPPEDADSPSVVERQQMLSWIRGGLHFARSRPVERNGSVRRLTVAQYRNTLRSLLGLREDVAVALPADAVSKEGFTNNASLMTLSPLQLEAYFKIARKALDQCIVDPQQRPKIQHFRVQFGRQVNPEPLQDKLILGANSHLLNNADFLVTQPVATRSYAFDPLPMRTHYRFNEGYQGNGTVRGWREYSSIYHSVFACMRGNAGYPKGNAYDLVPSGLLLRPAIPSLELFQVESTYGPRANFKIAVRELPRRGNFRVRVQAEKYEDGLLLGPDDEPRQSDSAIHVPLRAGKATLDVLNAGIYQVDVLHGGKTGPEPDSSRLAEGSIAHWDFDGNAIGQSGKQRIEGKLNGGARLVDSPFGRALEVDGKSGSLVARRGDQLNVGDTEFSVAAWIHPRKLRQGGIVCIGKYSWVHGWYFDMPNSRGVLRIETVAPNHQPNGTVQTAAGVIKPNRWQHVAAVVRRAPGKTELFVNGYKVASGLIRPENLDNPSVDLHIGRIQESKLFQGSIDEVRIYRRALSHGEIQALVEPGRQFATAPPVKPKPITLQLGDRYFASVLKQPAFLAVRLPAQRMAVRVDDSGGAVDRLVLHPLADDDPLAIRFKTFEQQDVHLGVHVGLRRDCGHTMSQVGKTQAVRGSTPHEYSFTGAINDFPSPEVEEHNDNYLAGVREIGVRSEYTDGRERPRLLVQSVDFEGPYFETWPPKTHQRIFFDSPERDNVRVYARQVIAAFATRAFRRPVLERELDSLMAVWRDAYEQRKDLHTSVRDALTVVLSSPQFLFLTEVSSSPQAEPLGDFELASKLSYFLWNEPPDQELLNLAATGKLRAQLESQTNRLIDDPRFRQFTAEFASQWLSLDKFDVVEIDRRRFRQLTRETATSLRREPAAFLTYLFRENLQARNLVSSDFMLCNEITAKYYQLDQQVSSGFGFTSVKHDTAHLGGLLTQAGILAGLSDGRESNPVKRGAWFARKIIAEPPDDPPPNVPELSEDTTNLTLRERLEKHRNQKGCVNCHSGIDPWGMPFEQFDAGGLLKKGKTESVATLPDGTVVDGMESLASYLAEQRMDSIARSVLLHLTTYACGRSLAYNEIQALKREVDQWKEQEFKMRDAIHRVVKSDAFLMK